MSCPHWALFDAPIALPPRSIDEPVRRLEVFTGAGRRRTWCDEDEARIAAEIATSGARSVPWLDAMDYRRSSCLAGDVN